MPEPRDGFVFATTGESDTGLARRRARNLRQVMLQARSDLFTDPVFDRSHPVTPRLLPPQDEAAGPLPL